MIPISSLFTDSNTESENSCKLQSLSSRWWSKRQPQHQEGKVSCSKTAVTQSYSIVAVKQRVNTDSFCQGIFFHQYPSSAGKWKCTAFHQLQKLLLLEEHLSTGGFSICVVNRRILRISIFLKYIFKKKNKTAAVKILGQVCKKWIKEWFSTFKWNFQTNN